MYLGKQKTTVQQIILLIKGIQCGLSHPNLLRIKNYAADAAFCLHTANDEINEGNQTTIVTATYYHDASSALEREEKLREQAELKIPTDTITPLDPEEGEPL